MKQSTRYLWPVAVCLLAGLVASGLQQESLATWYPLLDKPCLTPPDSAFSAVWTVLYVLAGLSMGRIQTDGFSTARREWWAHVALGVCWSVAFFRLQEVLWGMGFLLMIDAVVADYMLQTYKKDKWAALCFAPYLLWLLWCSYLNAYIYIHN